MLHPALVELTAIARKHGCSRAIKSWAARWIETIEASHMFLEHDYAHAAFDVHAFARRHVMEKLTKGLTTPDVIEVSQDRRPGPFGTWQLRAELLILRRVPLEGHL